MSHLRLSLLIACLQLAGAAQSQVVLLAGATGKSGVPTYAELKKLPGVTVRALVRNVTKAKALLGCNKCDESEGIFVGDVTKPETLVAATKGADVLVSTLGSEPRCKNVIFNCHYSDGAAPKDVNYEGYKALAMAFAKAGGRQAVLMSTAGTTHPDTFLDKMGKGFVGFYSFQAEAWLMSSGLKYTIVEACGLSDGQGYKRQLLVGHDDAGFDKFSLGMVARADVARVLAAAVAAPELASGLRFDFCSSPFGKPTADARDVFKMAMYPWDQRAPSSQPIAV